MCGVAHHRKLYSLKALWLLSVCLLLLPLLLVSCDTGETDGSPDSGSPAGDHTRSSGADDTGGSGGGPGLGAVKSGTVLFNRVSVGDGGRNIEVTTWAVSPEGGDPWRIENKTGIIPLQGRSFPDLTLSPDCTHLAYIAGKDQENDMNGRLMLMGADGSNPVQLSGLPAQGLAWSPDGTRIAFVEASQLLPISKPGEGTSERTPSVLHVLSVAGEELQTIPLPQPPMSIDWSSDGSRFTFAMNDLQRHFVDIYTMNVDGTGMTNITAAMRPENEEDYHTPETRAKAEAGELLMSGPGYPVWSHDAKRLAFISEEENSRSVWVINTESLQYQRIWRSSRVNGAFSAEKIAWSPDDAMIVLSAASDDMDPAAPRTGHNKLWLAAADGSSHRLLLEGEDDNLLLDWCTCREVPAALGPDT